MGQGMEEITPIPVQKTEERPSWLPEKFKSEQELVDSYGALERRLTEQGQQMSEMETTIERLIESQEYEDYQQPREQQPTGIGELDMLQLMEQYEEALASGDGRTALAIQLGINQNQLRETLAPVLQVLENMGPQEVPGADLMFAKMTEEEAAKRIGDDYEEIRGELADVLRENPHLMAPSTDPTEIANSIVLVADAVRGRRAAAAADSPEQRKLAAQTLRGRSIGGTPEAVELRDAIKQALSEVNTYSYGGR